MKGGVRKSLALRTILQTTTIFFSSQTKETSQKEKYNIESNFSLEIKKLRNNIHYSSTWKIQ